MSLLLAVLAAATSQTVDGWTLDQDGDFCIAASNGDHAGSSIWLMHFASQPDDFLVRLSNPAWSSAGEPMRQLTLKFVSLPEISADGRSITKYPTPDPVEIRALVDREAQGQGKLTLLMSFQRRALVQISELSLRGVHVAFWYNGKALSDYWPIRPFVIQHLDKCSDPFRK